MAHYPPGDEATRMTMMVSNPGDEATRMTMMVSSALQRFMLMNEGRHDDDDGFCGTVKHVMLLTPMLLTLRHYPVS